MLSDPGATDRSAVLAGLILAGPGHRHRLEDEELLALMALERSGSSAWSVRHVVRAVHESRGVRAAALRAFLEGDGEGRADGAWPPHAEGSPP